MGKFKKTARVIGIVVLAVVIVCEVVLLARFLYLQNKQNAEKKQLNAYLAQIKELETMKDKEGVSSLSGVNGDFVAWIKCADIGLSLPIVQARADAAGFYLAKMLYAGEDIKFIARRIMICAAEDVGLADPNALNVAVSASLAVERVGMPEAQIILAEAATYVACAPKSNSSYEAVFAAMKTVGSVRTSVPPHLQDAHYKGSAKLGHGEGYQYAHDYPNHYVEQQYLPDEILGSRFLHLGTNGYEQKIRENFKKIGKDIE